MTIPILYLRHLPRMTQLLSGRNRAYLHLSCLVPPGTLDKKEAAPQQRGRADPSTHSSAL